MDKQTKSGGKKHNIFSCIFSRSLSKEQQNNLKIQEEIDRYEKTLDWMYGANEVSISLNAQNNTIINSKH